MASSAEVEGKCLQTNLARGLAIPPLVLLHQHLLQVHREQVSTQQVKEIFDYSQKISCDYRTVLFQNEYLRQNFELLCIYARRFSGLIPISFLTGFYVTQVVSRWWSEFLTLPWPDKIAFKLVSYIPGKVFIHFLFIISECPKFCNSPQDLFRKNLRRTVIRYVNLSTVLVYRLVSLRVQQRFPVRFFKHPSCGKNVLFFQLLWE